MQMDNHKEHIHTPLTYALHEIDRMADACRQLAFDRAATYASAYVLSRYINDCNHMKKIVTEDVEDITTETMLEMLALKDICDIWSDLVHERIVKYGNEINCNAASIFVYHQSAGTRPLTFDGSAECIKRHLSKYKDIKASFINGKLIIQRAFYDAKLVS